MDRVLILPFIFLLLSIGVIAYATMEREFIRAKKFYVLVLSQFILVIAALRAIHASLFTVFLILAALFLFTGVRFIFRIAASRSYDS